MHKPRNKENPKIPKYSSTFCLFLVEMEKVLLIFCRNPIFLLHLSNLLLLLLLIKLLAHLGLLIVQNNQIPIRHVETRQVIHRRFGVVDILVNYKGRSSRVLVCADPYLANRPVLSENIVHLLARDIEGKVSDVEDAIHLRWKTSVALPETDCGHRDFEDIGGVLLLTEQGTSFWVIKLFG